MAIVQMDQTTQQNAAPVEQASAAAQSLQHEAAVLARTVGALRIAGAGGVQAAALAAAPKASAPAAKAPLRKQLARPAVQAGAAQPRAAENRTAAATAGDGREAF